MRVFSWWGYFYVYFICVLFCSRQHLENKRDFFKKNKIYVCNRSLMFLYSIVSWVLLVVDVYVSPALPFFIFFIHWAFPFLLSFSICCFRKDFYSSFSFIFILTPFQKIFPYLGKYSLDRIASFCPIIFCVFLFLSVILLYFFQL